MGSITSEMTIQLEASLTGPPLPSRRFVEVLSKLCTAVVYISLVLISAVQFFGRTDWLAYEEDDFFYYLKVAYNFSHGLGSTFGDGVSTNGYHPLWFLLLAAACRVSAAPSMLAVRVFLAFSIFISGLATYLLGRKLLESTSQNPALNSALAALVALYAMRIFCGGMEIILTIPLIMALALVLLSVGFWEQGFWHFTALGLLAAALFLSRLDSVILIGLLGVTSLIQPDLRHKLSGSKIIGFTLGLGGPSFIYLLCNHLYFHTWLPVSGQAKQLKLSHMPSLSAWRSISKGNLAFLLIIFLGILVITQVYRYLDVRQKVVFPVLLLFPLVHVFILSCLSDWNLWPWYFYGFRTALCVTFALLLIWKPGKVFLARPIILVTMLVMIPPIAYYARRNAGPSGSSALRFAIYRAACQIRDFAATHPGVYAMGDRAGMAGYLIPAPIIQTEGLMMDKRFLISIRNRTPLRTALNQYHVRYYIATTPEPYSGCFHAVEPKQAGPQSPKMEGDFCQPPVATFVNSGAWTYIFDLDATPSSPAPFS